MEVFSAEFTYELQPVDITPIGVQSAEFGREILSIPFQINPQSAEFGREIANAYGTLNPISAEFGFEVTSGELPSSITVNPASAEFTWELRPVDITPIAPAESEYGREFHSVSIGFFGVSTSEYDWAASSQALVKNVSVQSAEFEYEVAGPTQAPSSLAVDGAEFDREHRSAALAYTYNLITVPFEKTWELRPVDITTITPAGSDYGREIGNTAFSFNAVTPQSSEFGREILSVLVDTDVNQAALPGSAEFSWELQPFTFIVPTNAEFDNESDSVLITETGPGQPVEFDWEAESVAISLAINAQPDTPEFDHEIQSVRISLNVPVVGVEFEREFGSAEISRIIYPGTVDRGWEADGPTVTHALEENEFVWEAGSPSVVYNAPAAPDSAEFEYEMRSVRLPGQSAPSVDSAEFGHEQGTVRLKHFQRRAKTPRDRIKIVRQI